jgi:hypothetical protein
MKGLVDGLTVPFNRRSFVKRLNGSTQHSGRAQLALKTKSKSLARVRSAGTLSWLGFGRVMPNRSILSEKQYQIND